MNAREYGIKLFTAAHELELTPVKAAILLVMSDGATRDRNAITREMGWGNVGGHISHPMIGLIKHWLIEYADEMGLFLRITDKWKHFVLQMLK